MRSNKEFEELDKKSIITFPKPVEMSEVRAIFEYILANSPCASELFVQQKEGYGISYSDGEIDVKGIVGRIEKKGNPLSSAGFTLDREHDSETQRAIFSRLRFDTIPGYSLEEHSKHEREIWDGAREAIRGYFERKA